MKQPHLQGKHGTQKLYSERPMVGSGPRSAQTARSCNAEPSRPAPAPGLGAPDATLRCISRRCRINATASRQVGLSLGIFEKDNNARVPRDVVQNDGTAGSASRARGPGAALALFAFAMLAHRVFVSPGGRGCFIGHRRHGVSRPARTTTCSPPHAIGCATRRMMCPTLVVGFEFSWMASRLTGCSRGMR